jgi:MFS family permease
MRRATQPHFEFCETGYLWLRSIFAMTTTTTAAAPTPSESTALRDAAQTHPHLGVTRRWENLRGLFMGIVGRGVSSLGLLVAVKHFQSADAAKGWLAAADAIGLLLTPLTVLVTAQLGLSVSRANALILAAASAGLVFAACVHAFWAYMAGLMLALPLLGSTPPLITALYRQNIPDTLRGTLFSWTSTAGLVGGLLGVGLVTLFVYSDAGNYQPVLFLLSAALLAAAWCAWHTPSRPLEARGLNPFGALVWLWRDPTFGYLCFAWMIMGFGNLAVMPLRVEYVGNPEWGLNYENWKIVLLVTAVPEIFRFLSVRFWGRWFDRSNFIALRIVLNLLFAANIFLFFSPNFWMQVAASICVGLGQGGGEIAWNLWVTKFSPPERTAEYMSVHSFLTGTRGVAAPTLAFALLRQVGFDWLSAISVGLMLLACVLLLPLWKKGSRMKGVGWFERNANEDE